ncbi:cyclin family protein NDAI_0A03030 [Naumovozyma dairenensis CBS 421]|uniref:Cyclin N-terminal domain-containing protein n=1 Tax=Naumovozyma dairenensis (strain ATCC 10597 / BCRC 20456 / CBS 421 / NBRC 0211 / NRRL Y-12639) TaxID=1071378 RepID=G0W3S2_NAUDC|nr:hypothetical protein NDAI_0A03030 [Naumovozyma dairenensis CBS 421]CCD22460.1 hypothetical protein NDAI_0A03030 [Naumovozyma dairenensis CBS 421]
MANNLVNSADLSKKMIKTTTPITMEFVYFLSAKATIIYGDNRPNKLRSLPTLTNFILDIISTSNVESPTLSIATVYLERIRSTLAQDKNAFNQLKNFCNHQLFLACLMLSSKFSSDLHVKTSDWSRFANGLFTLKEINTAEITILDLFHYHLMFTEQNLAKAIESYRPNPFSVALITNKNNSMHVQKDYVAIDIDALISSNDYNVPANSRTNSNQHSYVPRKDSRTYSNNSFLSTGSHSTFSTIDDPQEEFIPICTQSFNNNQEKIPIVLQKQQQMLLSYKNSPSFITEASTFNNNNNNNNYSNSNDNSRSLTKYFSSLFY